MTHINIPIDSAIHRAIRVTAAERGQTVRDVVRQALANSFVRANDPAKQPKHRGVEPCRP